MTISLHPKELGEVAIHLRRSQDGSTAITITADRNETLLKLSHNVAHLHAALDAADLPATNRILTFSGPTAPALAHAGHSLDSANQNAAATLDQTNLTFGENPEQRPPRGQSSQQESATRQPLQFDKDAIPDISVSRVSAGTKQDPARINITA